MKYVIVWSDSAQDLARNVSNLMEYEGYKPLGGVSICANQFGKITRWAQAMVKREVTK